MSAKTSNLVQEIIELEKKASILNLIFNSCFDNDGVLTEAGKMVAKMLHSAGYSQYKIKQLMVDSQIKCRQDGWDHYAYKNSLTTLNE